MLFFYIFPRQVFAPPTSIYIIILSTKQLSIYLFIYFVPPQTMFVDLLRRCLPSTGLPRRFANLPFCCIAVKYGRAQSARFGLIIVPDWGSSLCPIRASKMGNVEVPPANSQGHQSTHQRSSICKCNYHAFVVMLRHPPNYQMKKHESGGATANSQ